MLQLVKATSLDEEQKEYILTAIKSSRRLTGLLSDILDLSRVEAGRLVLQKEEFTMERQKESVLELFSVAARQKSLSLEFSIDQRIPPTLIGDGARLRQILFNLVGNAIKFTEKGSIRVQVSALSAPRPDFVRVLFMVEDTGIGIPDDRMEHLFEPFVQGEGAYVREHQGAGLGLSIVSKLVRLMGGDLSIGDTEGGGATIYLSLPFTLPGARACPAEKAGQVTGHLASASPSAPLRILFAEDDDMNLLGGQRLLEKSGYVVTPARDGQEALERLAEQDFDLVLMDIQMPVMDGLEATRAIRASNSFGSKSRVPIIAMTAYAMTGDREKFLDAGMDGYIAKPVDIEELKRVIKGVLADAGRGQG